MGKQFKRYFCAVLAGTLMLGAAAVAVQAEDIILIAPRPVTSAASASGTCGFSAAWSIEGDVLTVSGSGMIDNFDYNKAPWSGKQFSSVVISEGITSIGNYAFSASDITSITLPGTIESIGIGAFKDCKGLLNIILPEKVTVIRNLTFAGCDNLAGVTLPDDLKRIGNMAFEGCASLVSIELPASLEELGSAAFNECTSLSTITIPENVTEIPYNVFGYCTSLSSAVVPASVKSIHKYAFSGCEKLTLVGAFNSNAHAYALENELAFSQTGTLDVNDDNYAWNNPFKDIHESAWYYDGVKYVNVKGIMNGMSADEFQPTGNLTRSMFVTILYRIEGSPAVGAPNFTDVAKDSWYAAPVAWASANGIVNGVSATEFAPDVNITNEQMATIVYRYAKMKGYDIQITGELKYNDKRSVSDWAKDAVIWMNEKGIMIGNNDGTFAPSVSSTRGQAADVFAKFMTQFK